MLCTENAVADYVRETYAHCGLEVISTGSKTIKIACPPQLDGLSEFILDLMEKYEVSNVDLEMTHSGMELTVWHEPKAIESTNEPKAAAHTTQPRNTISSHVYSYKHIFVVFIAIMYIMWTRGDAIWHDIQAVTAL